MNRMKTRFRKHVTHRRGTTNVFADLGYGSPQSMRVKAQLVSRITELMAARGMPRTRAATVLGIARSKLSKILRGQFRELCERKLLDWLTQLRLEGGEKPAQISHITNG